MNSERAIVDERAEWLARATLTRRLNVDVHSFGGATDNGIDLICTIRDDEAKGFLPFGVIVIGTAKALADGEEVAAFVRQKLKALDTKFFLPVIVLVFSMSDDAAFFGWLVKPEPDSGKLIHFEKPLFRPFTTRQLDLVVETITGWYRKLASALVETETAPRI